MPKQHFVKTDLVLRKVMGSLSNKLPFSFHFLSFFFSFLTSQTHFEDAFSEDERLKPLMP